MTIRGTVIKQITRVGDVGEPGYTVSGEDVPACKKSGHHDHFYGDTEDSLIYVMPTCYITRSVYNFLTESERNEIRSKVIAVCEDDCIHIIPNPYYGGGQCWALNESKIITDFPYQGDIMTTNGDEIDDEPTDDEPIHNDIPTDEEYPPKSELAIDISSIFGDIDTKWIIIALIAIALIGILSG